MEFLISMIFLLLGLIFSSLFWKFSSKDKEHDRWLAAEADRCLNRFCEVDDQWDSRGRMYTRGLAVIEYNGKKRFVKQAKLCDIGILD